MMPKTKRAPAANIESTGLKKASEALDLVRHKWITMDNALLRSGHGLTLAEKRLVSLAASKIDSFRRVNPMNPPRTRITAAEYSKEFDVEMCTAYIQLQDAAKHLYNRSITFFEPAHIRNGKPIKPPKHVMRWVGRATYHEHEGWIELSWWHEIIPALFGLKKNFTSYQLKQASALRSIHSWRLLELLMRYESTGWAEYSIEDFAASMEATTKQRENFAAIRRKIIEPAIKELTQKDNWLIEWRPINKGRRVAGLHFKFSRNPQGRLL